MPINGFVLSGSGNGWGVWLTGAVDDRVRAIAPIRFDLLNIDKQIDHQVGLRGELSPFLAMFSDQGVMPELDSEKGRQLLKIIDPYEYRDRLTMPKLLLLPGGGRPLATVDAANLFLSDLKGETYLFCAPGLVPDDDVPLLAQAETGLAEEAGLFAPSAGRKAAPVPSAKDLRLALRVLFHRLLVGKPMPEFSWEISPEGAFEVTTSDEEPPVEVRLWLAESGTRDFESAAANGRWFMEKLKGDEKGVYQGKISQVKDKYRAFYIELVYPSKLGVNFSLTTPVNIVTPIEGPNRLAMVTRSSQSRF